MEVYNASHHNVPYLRQAARLSAPAIRRSHESTSEAPRRDLRSIPAELEQMTAQVAALETSNAAQAAKIGLLEETVAALKRQVEEWRAELDKRARLVAMSEEMVQQLDRRITLADLLAVVEACSGVSIEVLLGPRRASKAARPRQMVCFLANTFTPLASLPQIGRALGDRDHTTVMHAIRAVNKRLLDKDAETMALRDRCFVQVEALIEERKAQ